MYGSHFCLINAPLCIFIHLKIYLCIFYTYVQVPTCMYEYHMHTWCPHRPKEDIRSLGTRMTDSCQSPDVGALNWSRHLCKNSCVLFLTAKKFSLQPFVLCSWLRVLLCGPGTVDPPVSVCWVLLGLPACAAIPGFREHSFSLLKIII